MKEVFLVENEEGMVELANNLVADHPETGVMETESNAVRFQPHLQVIDKEVEEYPRDGFDDLRKKEEKYFKENEQNNGDFDGDVCPICLDSFTIACRSNCGHLFCATCILQLWMYRYSIHPCKCPLCCCRIVNLELQTSHHLHLTNEEEEEDDDVRKEVKHYNDLYNSPLFGALQIIPLLMGRIFRVVVDLDSLRCIYYIMRVIGLFLGLIYERLEFEFVPTGGMGIQRMFDFIASLLVAALFLVGVVYRWMLKRRRSRLLAAIDS